MKSGVRNFDPNTGHMIGINKKCSKSTGSQTTANGQVTITAIFMTPSSPVKNVLKMYLPTTTPFIGASLID